MADTSAHYGLHPSSKLASTRLRKDTTLAEELGQRGRDLVDTLRQRSREKELLKQLGLQEAPTSQSPGGDHAEQPEEAAAAE